MLIRMSKWLCFGVLIALVPLGFQAVHLTLRQAPVSLVGLTGEGELILIAVALLAAGLGEIVCAREVPGLARLFLCAFAVLTLLFATYAFGEIATMSLLASSIPPNTTSTISGQMAVNASLLFYAVAIFLSGICVFIAGAFE